MATKTRADLIKRTLKVLGVLAAGQDPAAEDYETVDEQIDPKLADLSARDVIVLSATDEFDEAVFLPLAAVMAHAVAADFGVQVPLGSMSLLDAENALRRQQQNGPFNSPIPIEFY